MTYCLGIVTRDGLVLASDRRTNAGLDQVNKVRKMHILERPGERVFTLLTAGSLSCTQSIVTLLQQDFEAGRGMAAADTFYEAVREVGRRVREVAELDREALKKYTIERPTKRPDPARLIKSTWLDRTVIYTANDGKINFMLTAGQKGLYPYFKRGVRTEIVPNDGSAQWKQLWEEAQAGPVTRKA